jgi:hypothetical protein
MFDYVSLRDRMIGWITAHKSVALGLVIMLLLLAAILFAVFNSGKSDSVASGVLDGSDLSSGGSSGGVSGSTARPVGTPELVSNPAVQAVIDAVFGTNVGTLLDYGKEPEIWENGLIITDDGPTNGRKESDNPTDAFGHQASMPYDYLTPSGQRRYGENLLREYDNTTKTGRTLPADTSEDNEQIVSAGIQVNSAYAGTLLSEADSLKDTITYLYSESVNVTSYKASIVSTLTKAQTFADDELKVKINAVLTDLSVCGDSAELVNVLCGGSAKILFGSAINAYSGNQPE